MEKLQIQNMGLPRFRIIFCTKHCVYFSDNRALPQVLTCGKRIVVSKPRERQNSKKTDILKPYFAILIKNLRTDFGDTQPTQMF